MGAPYVKHIEESIWELRPLRNRIFFFYWRDNTFVVLLHHYMKKSQKMPTREPEKAKKNLKDFLVRKGSV
ncbi:MAG: type II toxin-antitoxin system RelE/ParE family toxin [Lachnospiraceae bacterium]|nr:type II toxin-antitoxin system RelE/ParE family toxin [Lachnospiraceae bacterium]